MYLIYFTLSKVQSLLQPSSSVQILFSAPYLLDRIPPEHPQVQHQTLTDILYPLFTYPYVPIHTYMRSPHNI